MGKHDTEEERKARRQVNAEVRTGKRPHPNTVPCVDCGHTQEQGARRHEYDHTAGYDDRANWLTVESVCTTCHHQRTARRLELEQLAAAARTPNEAVLSNERRIELMELQSINAAKRNPKDHDLGEIITSIRRFGFADAGILDERTQRLVAGHGRLEALRSLFKAGAEFPPAGVVVKDGAWWVPVQRGWASKDDDAAEAFIIAANKIPELGGWHTDLLESMLVDIAKSGEEALAGVGFDAGDVDEILQEISRAGAKAAGAEQAAPNEVAELYVNAGELWILGEHRLLVGDTTKPEDMKRLLDGKEVDAVISDPPYAIYGSSSGIGADIADDKMVRPFFEMICRIARLSIKTFGHVYLCTDWRSFAALWDGAKRAELAPKGTVVWDKGDGGMGSMWANCFELIGFFTKTPPAKTMKHGTPAGQRQIFKPNIQRFPRVAGEEREHNAAKPVALMSELVDASTDRGGLVLDFFGGSGSTLMACEDMGRRCFTMEIEPKWAQVIVERWQRKTGKKAERVNLAGA